MIDGTRLMILCSLFLLLDRPMAIADARADKPATEDEKKRAKEHYDQACEHYDAGRDDLAITEYVAAYDILPLPQILFDLGQVHKRKGHRWKAIKYYKRYLVTAADGPRAEEARREIGLLARRLAIDPKELEGPEREHFQRAMKKCEEKKYQECVAEFKATYEILPVPDFLFNIARAYQGDGNSKLALEFYEAYARAQIEGGRIVEARRQIRFLTRVIKQESKSHNSSDNTSPAP